MKPHSIQNTCIHRECFHTILILLSGVCIMSLHNLPILSVFTVCHFLFSVQNFCWGNVSVDNYALKQNPWASSMPLFTERCTFPSKRLSFSMANQPLLPLISIKNLTDLSLNMLILLTNEIPPYFPLPPLNEGTKWGLHLWKEKQSLLTATLCILFCVFPSHY